MCEVPEAIVECFDSLEMNTAGIYLVYFYVNGRKTPVIIDDFFPCPPLRGRQKNYVPAFAKGHDAELWVMILEKAWAKLHGTYFRTEAGFPSFAA